MLGLIQQLASKTRVSRCVSGVIGHRTVRPIESSRLRGCPSISLPEGCQFKSDPRNHLCFTRPEPRIPAFFFCASYENWNLRVNPAFMHAVLQSATLLNEAPQD